MALEQTANAAQSTLNGAINNSTTSIVVSSASSFSTTGNFRIIIDSEIMKVTSVSGSTFTATRGQEGTSAASHANGATVTQVLTAAGIAAFRTDHTGFINVKTDYGATGDGSTDDTTAISNAIAAASVTPGIAIQFPPGTYICNTLLTLDGQKVSMMGIGGQAILKKKAGSTPSILRITGDYNRISDLEFDGSNVVAGNSGIECYGIFNIIERCFAYNNTGHGFLFDGSTGGGNTASNNWIRDCYSHHNGGIGIAMNTATDNTIYGCQSWHNGLEGVTVDVSSFRNKVIACWIAENCQTGGAGNISLDKGDISIIKGNHVLSAFGGRHGIVFNNTGGDSSYIIIEGNMVFDNTGKGIYLKASTGHSLYCVVNGNVLRGNTGTAIHLEAGCNNNIVVGNTTNGGTITNSGTGNQVANNT